MKGFVAGTLLLGATALAVAGSDTSGLLATRAAAQESQGQKRWIVMFNQQHALPDGAAASVASAGGTVLATLHEVGTVVALSSDPQFPANAARLAQVAEVLEDRELQMIPPHERLAARVLTEAAAAAGPIEPPGDDTQTGPDPFYNAFQWDKKRMRASTQGSYAVQQGRPDVVVAVLDSGADVLPVPHADIANPATGTHFDAARSRAFFPVQANPDGDPNPAALDDKNRHGSWCLSAIGAPINGIGMVGVAPQVTLVALKVLGDTGTGSYVALAQALIYAADNKFDIASMSLGGYLPRSDQSANALIRFVHRAVNYARQNGDTPIAALGNDSFNISDGRFMQDYILVPGEVSSVIGVSATGYFNVKASYSNYGVGKTDVSAPGGDFAVQTPVSPIPLHQGSVLGAWATEACGFPNCYVFASGTSMATPNAAGVAALIISQYGDFDSSNGTKPHMPPQAVASILQRTANNQPCPSPNAVNYFTVIPLPGIPMGTPIEAPNQRCQGGAGYNNFYGKASSTP